MVNNIVKNNCDELPFQHLGEEENSEADETPPSQHQGTPPTPQRRSPQPMSRRRPHRRPAPPPPPQPHFDEGDNDDRRHRNARRMLSGVDRGDEHLNDGNHIITQYLTHFLVGETRNDIYDY